jgi:hypothetical protein
MTVLLAGLDAVPWPTLEHAYGDAADTPARIRALRDGSAAERGEAQYWLSCSIHHQGTIYSAAAPAVLRRADAVEPTWLAIQLGKLAGARALIELWTRREDARASVESAFLNVRPGAREELEREEGGAAILAVIGARLPVRDDED